MSATTLGLELGRVNRNLGVWVHARDARTADLRWSGGRPRQFLRHFDRDFLIDLGKFWAAVQVHTERVSAAQHKPHQVLVLSDAADPIAAGKIAFG